MVPGAVLRGCSTEQGEAVKSAHGCEAEGPDARIRLDSGRTTLRH